MQYRELIEKMTLEEKASLMSGKDFWETQEIPHLGIPALFLADGPHGIRKQAVSADHLGLNASLPATCFPTAATVANSWNIHLGTEIGNALGDEAVAARVNVLLGPGINMKRNPLCGRNFEYFSEDPYLAGKLAAAYIRGIQSRGIAACVKHFAANNQEQGRMTIDTVVDERTLREIYLTAFEIAVQDGQTKTLMSSYNRLNGTYTNESPFLMTTLLRGEWGYQGVVVTDWGGSNDRVSGLRVGNELEMPTTGGETNQEIIDAVRAGTLDEALLDAAVDRLLALAFSTNQALAGAPEVFDVAAHHRLAQRVAEESIVLLKNEGDILPLVGKTVAIIGDFAQQPRYQGAGSSIVNPTRLDQTLEGLGASGLTSVGFEPGFRRYGKADRRLVRRACALAAKADVAVLYLGLDEVTESEGLDRRSLDLPANQVALLEAVHTVNPNVVVVLSCGAVVSMPWLGRVKGLVHGYLGGQAGAPAVLRVLTGEVNPSGKLAETYPLAYQDVPSAPYFPGREATVEYREGPFLGYRYFATTKTPVLFPFGYGLSYTSFSYSDLTVSATGVQFDLTNTGTRAGKEVVQLYVGLPGARVFRPVRELKAFDKIALEPGQSRRVTLSFDDKSFRYFNVKTGRWEVEGGQYEILVGASSEDIRLVGTLEVAGTGTPSPYDERSLPSYFHGKVTGVSDSEFEALLGRRAPAATWDRTRPLGYNDTIAQCQYARGAMARVVYGLLVFGRWTLGRLGQRQAANLMEMAVFNLPFRGIARMTGGLLTLPMVDGLLTMANGHFFRGLVAFLKANGLRSQAKKRRMK